MGRRRYTRKGGVNARRQSEALSTCRRAVLPPGHPVGYKKMGRPAFRHSGVRVCESNHRPPVALSATRQRQRRSDGTEERPEPSVDRVRHAGLRKKVRQMVTKRTAQTEIPMARVFRGRDLDMPRSNQMAERGADCTSDRIDNRFVLDSRDVYRDDVMDNHVATSASAAPSRSARLGVFRAEKVVARRTNVIRHGGGCAIHQARGSFCAPHRAHSHGRTFSLMFLEVCVWMLAVLDDAPDIQVNSRVR